MSTRTGRSRALVTVLLLSSGIAGAGSARAAHGDEGFARPGWYGGITAIYAISDYDLSTDDLGVVPPEPTATDPRFTNTGGVDGRLGYRVSARLAAEFDYQWQAGYDSTNTFVNPMVEIDTHLLSLNAKAFAGR